MISRQFLIGIALLWVGINLGSLLYYFGHWILFTRRVFRDGEHIDATLVEKKIITNRGIKEKHGINYNNSSDQIYMLFCCCTYVLKVREGRTTKKDVRVMSVEPLYCYYKKLNKDYEIRKLEFKTEPSAKFRHRKVWVSTKHDYYIILVNVLGMILPILIYLMTL